MLKNQQKKLSLSQYALLRILFLLFTFFINCNCLGCLTKGIVPKTNALIANLPHESKTKLLNLNNELRDNNDQLNKLQKDIDNVKDPEKLKAFIKQRFDNQEYYNFSLKLLHKSERNNFKEKFNKITNIEAQTNFITKYKIKFSTVLDYNDDSNLTRMYVDLVELLPSNDSMTLQNKVLETTNPDQVYRVIRSEFDKIFESLSDSTKEARKKRILRFKDDHERQNCIKKIMAIVKSKKTDNPNPTKPIQKLPNKTKLNLEETQPITNEKDRVDQNENEDEIDEIINKSAENDDKTMQNVSNDDWGKNLDLEEPERHEFLTILISFQDPRPPQTSLILKTMLNALSRCKRNSDLFFGIYRTQCHTVEDRTKLLQSAVCIYRKDPNLVVRLCSTPVDNIGIFDEGRVGFMWLTIPGEIKRFLERVTSGVAYKSCSS